MIENEFPIVRETVKDSLVGRSVSWLAAALASATVDATITRQLAAIRSTVVVDAPTAVRIGGITFAVAATAAWGLSLFIPRYVATAIPGVAFVIVVALGAIAAARADVIAAQWRTSRLRRLTTWLTA